LIQPCASLLTLVLRNFSNNAITQISFGDFGLLGNAAASLCVLILCSSFFAGASQQHKSTLDSPSSLQSEIQAACKKHSWLALLTAARDLSHNRVRILENIDALEQLQIL
jgi:hypothetical protein